MVGLTPAGVTLAGHARALPDVGLKAAEVVSQHMEGISSTVQMGTGATACLQCGSILHQSLQQGHSRMRCFDIHDHHPCIAFPEHLHLPHKTSGIDGIDVLIKAYQRHTDQTDACGREQQLSRELSYTFWFSNHAFIAT